MARNEDVIDAAAETGKDFSDLARIYIKRAKGRVISKTLDEAQENPLAYDLAFSYTGKELTTTIGKIIRLQAENQSSSSNCSDDVTFI